MAELLSATGGPEAHDQHDLELIAALLDRDLPGGDRVFAEARIAACPDCSALHDDLLALAKANRDLPIPARPRDYTITLDVAASLAGMRAGEPIPVGARLTGEMTDARSAHATHDRILVASLVGRSAGDSERGRAEAQVAACGECALLFDDLVALSAAIHALPAPSRSREFTLSPEDAERLRVRGWRRLFAAIGTSRDAFSRPLAVGLTTLGLAGLLVATIPSVLTGQASSTASLSTVGNAVGEVSSGAGIDPQTMRSVASAEPSAAPTSGPAAAAAPAPAASVASDAERQGPDGPVVGDGSSPLPGEGDLNGKNLAGEESLGASTVTVVASLLLLAGLGLFGLRWIARRLGDG